MTLQQLKYVITVAETGTITEAANRLYISQPSLTNAIHELEKEMNLVIFNRTNKGISISINTSKIIKHGVIMEGVLYSFIWPAKVFSINETILSIYIFYLIFDC